MTAQTLPGQGRSLQRHAQLPIPPEGPLPAADRSAITQRWGVEIASMRLASTGYMLELGYRSSTRTRRSRSSNAGWRPILSDDASGFQSTVPNPPTTGALREAVGSDKPVLVNFMFTTRTTIGPVMSHG